MLENPEILPDDSAYQLVTKNGLSFCLDKDKNLTIIEKGPFPLATGYFLGDRVSICS